MDHSRVLCHPLPSSLCRVFIRSAQQFVHGIIPASNLAADRHNLDDVVGSISREMGFTIPFRKASSQSAVEDKLLRVDEVCVVCVRACVRTCMYFLCVRTCISPHPCCISPTSVASPPDFCQQSVESRCTQCQEGTDLRGGDLWQPS